MTTKFSQKSLVINPGDNEDLILSLKNEIARGNTELDHEGNYTISYDQWHSLDIDTRFLLDICPEYPFSTEFDSIGTIGTKEGRYKILFREFPKYGKTLDFRIKGPFLLMNNKARYVLNDNDYKLVNHTSTYTYHNMKQALEHLSVFQQLAKESNCYIDSKLGAREIIIPNKIHLNPIHTGNELKIDADVDVSTNEEFKKRLNEKSVKEKLPFINKKGKRSTALFNAKQVIALNAIKEFNQLTEEQKHSIAAKPIAFFDENVIDLELFSERVKEIGLFKPKVYPFISPYKSVWIPGIQINEPNGGGTVQIKIKDQETLNEFKELYEKAKHGNNDSFQFKGHTIPLSNAPKIIEVAEEQINSPEGPIRTPTNPDPEVPEKDLVLIIKQNDEFLEYSLHKEGLTSFKHNFEEPPFLNKEYSLKPHQMEGVAWLQTLMRKEVNGALLADDMGLGKTIQVLSIIHWFYQNINSDKPSLIVAPISILENWKNEEMKFFSNQDLSFEIIQSGIPKLHDPQIVKTLQKPNKVFITNYETVRHGQLNFGAVDFNIIVLDEAQRIKTPGTLTTNAIKGLKSSFNLALTGTPVENSFVDIWSIIDFCVPGKLSDARSFADRYQKPLKKENTDLEQLGQSLRNEIGVLLKRRLKEDVVSDLPKKLEHTFRDTMPKTQEQTYCDILRAFQKEKDENPKNNVIFSVITKLKIASEHPFLVDRNFREYPVDDLIASSAKLTRTIKILEEVQRKGDKAIVFVEYLNTQKLLQKVIKSIFGLAPNIINGSVPSSTRTGKRIKPTRQALIDNFQSFDGFNVIIMSPVAAGVGLNVTGANHVIHYSRHWNPAKESQATDRAYRIGQKKTVHVYYPMAILRRDDLNGETKESFDETLHELLARKSTLAKHSLFPTERAEVTPQTIGPLITEPKSLPKENLYDFTHFCKLSPLLFEAAIAALYEKMGYEVWLTPKSNDYGADVLALHESKKPLVIQVKSSTKPVSNNGVQEIVASINIYSEIYGTNLSPVVVTNNVYTKNAIKIANAENVELIEIKKLEAMYNCNPLTYWDIQKQEASRISPF